MSGQQEGTAGDERINPLIKTLLNRFVKKGYSRQRIWDELYDENDPDDQENKICKELIAVYDKLYPSTPTTTSDESVALSEFIEIKAPPLRDYQITTVAKCQEEFARGATRCFIQLPTGAGKTLIMYKLISDDYNKIYAQSRIGLLGQMGNPIYIILAPRIKLSEQHCSLDNLKNLELAQGVTRPTVVIINSECKTSDISKQITDWQQMTNTTAPSQYPPPLIISGTYYSISRIHDLITKYKLGQVRYLFADEAHLISRWGHTAELGKSPHKKWVMDMPLDQRAALGLVFMTATPTKNQIGNHQRLWGQLINPVSIKQLIQDEILCPIETIIPNIRIDETDDAMMDNRNLCDILFKTLVKTQSHKAVIFCNTQAKCRELFKIFRQSKIYKTGPVDGYQIEPFIYVGDGYEPRNTPDTPENDSPDENQDASTTEDDNRPSEIDKFQDFAGPAVVFVCKKISMGYDFPPIDFIGFADPKCSRAELAQCIGRGLRTFTDKKTGYDKKCCRVFIPITPIDYNLDTLAKIKHGTLFQYLQYIKEDVGFQFDIDDREDVKKAKTNGPGFIKWSDKSELDILDVEFLDQQQIYLILSSESVLGRRKDDSNHDMNWDTYWRMRYIYYRQRNQEYGFRTIREYRDFDKNTSKHGFKDWLDPVYAPTQFGKHWLGWYDFLGIDISRFPPCINTWTAKCRELGIRNQTEYFARLVDNPTLPDEPESLYKGFANINLQLGVCGRRR